MRFKTDPLLAEANCFRSLIAGHWPLASGKFGNRDAGPALKHVGIEPEKSITKLGRQMAGTLATASRLGPGRAEDRKPDGSCLKRRAERGKGSHRR